MPAGSHSHETVEKNALSAVYKALEAQQDAQLQSTRPSRTTCRPLSLFDKQRYVSCVQSAL